MSSSTPNTNHEEFLDLCALSTSGDLTHEEQERLHEHLADCSDCRQALEQFETLVEKGISTLAPDLAGEFAEIDTGWSVEAAEARFFKRLSQEKANGTVVHAEAAAPLAIRRSRSARADGRYFWLPIAAAILLCATLGILTYRAGLRHGVRVARVEGRSNPGKLDPNETFEAIQRERNKAEGQLTERDKAISELRREMVRQSAENTKLKALQMQQRRSLATSDEEKRQLAAERDQFAQQVAVGEAALQASEKKLNGLEQKQSEDVIRSASLEGRVAELSRAVKDQEGTAELLAKDRDIRELMGARDLYVAEVYDVARTGETQKAFGRVFYTKGKSLIFYAYDLDDQPGLKEASTFEAWGRRAPDWTQAFKLGVFYQDNESKKRWVLKSNDKKSLDQIDAVFVTVEPHGGSDRPTGKSLLFAYLKVAPNHP
jgi:anti-sigma-K factor RskA